jgi:hypothetical protein
MKQSHFSFVGLASILLVTISSFAACGGLDPRKVSRGPDYSAGGDDATGGSSGPSAGGSDSKGGEPSVNPFGGNFDLGGAPPVVDGPPEVVEVDPVDGATDVEVNSSISFLFNEAVNPDTVSPDSIKLFDGDAEVTGDASLVQDQVASFEPSRRLALATTYTTSVSTDVTDTTNQSLAAEFTSTFTTRDGEWEVDVPMVNDPETQWDYYSYPTVGVDGRGNALVAWTQGGRVYGRWHRQATGWQPAQPMSAEGSYVYGNFGVAVGPEGDAVVAWYEYNDMLATNQIMVRRYVSGAWNAEPEVASPDLTIYGSPQGLNVAHNGGRILISWTHYNYSAPYYTYYVHATTTTSDGAFPAPVALAAVDGATGSYGQYIAAALDSSGNAMLVYDAVAAATYTGQLYFVKYVAATDNWEYAAPIAGASDVYGGAQVSLALDDAGVALVAWSNNTAPYDLLASRYTKAKGFSVPTPLDDLDTPTASNYRTGAVSDGTDFIVSWSQMVGSTSNAYANRYSTADGAWSGAKLISDGDTGVSTPIAAADQHGNSMVMWVQESAMPGPDAESNKEFRFTRWRAGDTAWGKSVVLSHGKNFNQYEGFSAATAANGIVALVYEDEGHYGDPADPNNLPRAPQGFLNVFQ